MNESSNALVRCKAEGIEDAAIIGIPLRDPVCPVTERMGGEDEAHRSGPGRKHLLPFRNFHVGNGAADHRDNQRRPREPIAFRVEVFRLRVGILRLERGRDRRAGGVSRLALKHNETPRGELAVIRYPRRDSE